MKRATAAYHGYEVWKGWNTLFQPSAEEQEYFEGETAGLAVRNADVLEIGFGSGSFMQWARSKGARICGTEINPRLHEAAVSAGFKTLPVALQSVESRYRQSFDTIVAFDVFEHLTIEQVIEHLTITETMLKPGGHMLLRFPNAQSPFGLAPQNGDPTHRSALSGGIIRSLVVDTGLTVIRYDHAYRILGQGVRVRLRRRIRYALIDLLGLGFNGLFRAGIPIDPVVSIVLQKS